MKSKKITIVLMLSLLFCSILPLTALADNTSITNVAVELQNNTVNDSSIYKIMFNSNQILNGGLDTIHIVFPSEYSFDTSWQAGHVDINGQTSGGVDYSNRTLSILIPKGMTIYGGQPVTVTLASGIMENPSNTGDYALNVYTAKETTPIKSAPFAITEFEYDGAVSKPHVDLYRVEGEAAEAIEISFNTNEDGQLTGGNDQIIITFPKEIRLPSSINKEKVKINDLAMTTAAPIIVGQQIFLPLSTTMNFPDNYPIKVFFAADSEIVLSKDKKDATLQVVTTTNTRPATSYPFDISETDDMPYIPRDAKDPAVSVSPNGARALGAYTFTMKPYTLDTFDSGNIMGFTLTFPTGTILPGTINPQYVTVNDQQCSGILTNPTRKEVIFTLPLGVARSSEIIIKISAEAGIQNPPAGQYIMDIFANKGLKTMSTKSFEIKTTSDPVIHEPVPEEDRVVKLTIDSIQATKNGIPIDLDVPAALIDGFTMVPVRFVSEGLGASIDYNNVQNTVNLSFGARTIVLWPGSTIAKVDNTPITLAKAPIIREGRTLVPIRFVAESFGATVEFISTSQPITIKVSSSNDLPSIAVIQESQKITNNNGSNDQQDDPIDDPEDDEDATDSNIIGKTVKLSPGNNTANLRSGPGTTYDKIGLLLPSETAKISKINNDWYYIQFNYGLAAWIRSDLVDIV